MAGVFVVLKTTGEVWTGRGWSAELHKARQFRGAGDPWARAFAVVAPLRACGCMCNVAYFAAGHGAGSSRPVKARQGKVFLF